MHKSETPTFELDFKWDDKRIKRLYKRFETLFMV